MSTAADEVRLEASWKQALGDEFQREHMRHLREFLQHEKRQRKVIYPKSDEIFAALNTTPLNDVKVVILGQDPYHGPNQAHGLCFSVKHGVEPPPSLQNIFREINDDLAHHDDAVASVSQEAGPEQPLGEERGCLAPWAEQGVLLLNAVLTVERRRAASHRDQGWERFTDRVIDVINAQREHVVFMLWGSYAQKKGARVDRERHLVLTAPHPSPLSAKRGFFGCRHFSQTNRYLAEQGREPINWRRVS